MARLQEGRVENRVSTARRMRWRLLTVLVVGVWAAAIGGAKGQSSPYATLTLAWEANHEPEVTGYFVFVGTRPGVYDARYDVGPEPRLRHVGMAGQEYFFAVAARSATAMSPLSAEVSGVGTPWFSVAAAVTGARSCPDCTAGGFRAHGLGEVSALTPAADGRLFFIEDGRHIRIAAVRDGAVLPPALSAAAGVRFTGLALAADFERSGHIFVAAARQHPDGTRELTIVRYRAVHGQLGEGTAVVGGLRLWSDRDAPFTVDHRGRIYVAMPGDGRAYRDPYAGYVLWFDGDGRVPTEARGGSPILAHGFASPVAVEADGGDLWLVGADADWRRSIARVTAHIQTGGEWPRVPTAVSVSSATGEMAAARAFDAGAAGGAGRAYVIDTEGRLQPLQTSGFGPLRALEPFQQTTADVPVAVAAGRSGELFVAVRQPDGASAIEEIRAGGRGQPPKP